MSSEHWTGRTVLVTGATGLMGSWLCKYLVDRGANTYALVHHERPLNALRLLGLYDQVAIVRGDLCDYPTCANVIASAEVRTIFHLAAQPIVRVGKTAPLGTLEANVRATYNLLEASRQANVPAVIIASSDKAYGDHGGKPNVERDALLASGLYDATKLCSDVLARSYAHSFQLNAAVTRCANLFGGADLHFSRSVPGIMGHIFVEHQHPHLSPDWPNDQMESREYLYVEDAATGYLAIAQALAEKPENYRGRAFNFGSGWRANYNELANKIVQAGGAQNLESFYYTYGGWRREDIKTQALDYSVAKTELGWQPTHTADDAIRETYEWYKALFEGNKQARNLWLAEKASYVK